MKFVIAFVALALAVAQCSPIESKDATITKWEMDNIGVDGYKFAFETSDGQARSEEAELHNAGSDHESIAVKGSLSYLTPDGASHHLEYTADETGYHPILDGVAIH